MKPATINTILNSAPLIIQAAGRLLRLIKERRRAADHNIDSNTDGHANNNTDNARAGESPSKSYGKATEPVTTAQLQAMLNAAQVRLDEHDQATVEQAQLILLLARQLELLANVQQRTMRRLTLVSLLPALALAAILIILFASPGLLL